MDSMDDIFDFKILAKPKLMPKVASKVKAEKKPHELKADRGMGHGMGALKLNPGRVSPALQFNKSFSYQRKIKVQEVMEEVVEEEDEDEDGWPAGDLEQADDVEMASGFSSPYDDKVNHDGAGLMGEGFVGEAAASLEISGTKIVNKKVKIEKTMESDMDLVTLKKASNNRSMLIELRSTTMGENTSGIVGRIGMDLSGIDVLGEELTLTEHQLNGTALVVSISKKSGKDQMQIDSVFPTFYSSNHIQDSDDDLDQGQGVCSYDSDENEEDSMDDPSNPDEKINKPKSKKKGSGVKKVVRKSSKPKPSKPKSSKPKSTKPSPPSRRQRIVTLRLRNLRKPDFY